MIRFILRRTGYSVLILLGVLLLTFLLFDLASGDPAAAVLGKNPLPAEIESLRRELGDRLESMPCKTLPMAGRMNGQNERIDEDGHREGELMRSKYCIRYELGLCPSRQGAAPTGPLFLVNNGRRFPLGFDCGACEMTVGIPAEGPR